MNGLAVVHPEDLQRGSLVLQVYGSTEGRIDDGLISSDETHGVLPLSTVAEVSELDENPPPDDLTWAVQLHDGTRFAVHATDELEVVLP